jgi:hypothetical protein
MGTMAALLPLGLKLVYLQELAHLNPLIPSQYWQLCRRIYLTITDNSGKVVSSIAFRCCVEPVHSCFCMRRQIY